MPRSSNLKERILKIAGEKFLSQGFYKISIDSLVSELRTSKSSIYKFFSSKEDLIATLIEQVDAIIDKQLAQIVENDEWGFEDKLLGVTRFTGKLLNLISRQFLEDLRIHTPDLYDAYRKKKAERILKYYLPLFAEGVDEGIIRNDMDLNFLLTTYLQLIELTIDQEKLSDIPYNAEELYENINTLFMEGALNQ